MKHIADMTKSEIKAMHGELDKVLEAFGQKYGLEFKPFTLSYGADGISFKASAIPAVDKSGKEIDTKKKEFEDFCEFFGFQKSDYRKVFTGLDEKKYKLVGFKPRAKKNCLILEGTNGSEYVAPKFFIKQETA